MEQLSEEKYCSLLMMIDSLQVAVRQLGEELKSVKESQVRDSKDQWEFIGALSREVRK